VFFQEKQDFINGARQRSVDVDVIEDVSPNDLLRYKEFFSKTHYIVDYVTMLRPNLGLRDNSLVVIRKG
jgi:hypothetical protein